jgi:hypothetical protein
MVCRFWWAQQEDENKVHWMSWDKLSLSKKVGGLGYKDLHSFNIAMLAKQGWRLLTDPNSLCARVLKAKYFPSTNVLHAEPKEGMSYTWRSILKGIELLKEGVIKRVGDGNSIDVWNDPWIMREASPFAITRRGNILIDHVSELLDPVSGSWDEELVSECLWPADAIHVLKILVRHGFEDFWAWRLDNKGQFSMRSAYKLHRLLLKPKGNSSNIVPFGVEEQLNWQDIWSCPCPPNVRQFLWRLAHDSLLHRCNIARRGVVLDPLCQVCHRLNEDGAHVFLRCKGVRQVWTRLALENVREKLLLCDGPKDMMNSILKLEQRDKIRCVAMLWEWWKHRNKINAEGAMLNVDEVVFSAGRGALEYEQFCVSSVQKQAQVLISWKPPDGEALKVNIDGSFFATTHLGGWGYVIRDSRAQVLGAAAGRIDKAYDAATPVLPPKLS